MRYCLTFFESADPEKVDYGEGIAAPEYFSTREKAEERAKSLEGGPRFRLAVLYDVQSGEWDYIDEFQL